MSCKLCAKNSPDSKYIDLYSVEANKLQIRQILQKHISILEIERHSKGSFLICRVCCKVLSDFHDLYVLVEEAQNAAIIQDTEPIDSDTPLSLLCDDLKIEADTIKLEPIYSDCIETEHPRLNLEKRNRRSKRIQASSTHNLCFQGEIPLEFEAKIVIKNEVTSRVEAGASTLNVACDNESAVCSSGYSEENNAAVKFETTGLRRQKRLKETSALHRKKLSSALSSALSKSGQTLKVESRKKSDEFLSNNFKLICSLCHIPLEDFSKLKKHYRSSHHIRGYATCCGKKFFKRGILVDHLQTHINPNYFKCSLCEKVSANRKCLLTHMRTHEKSERTFRCETCSKAFFSRANLKSHSKIHMPEEERNAKCPHCERKFSTTHILNHHIKNIHLNAYSRVCDVCGKSIKGREAFRLHQHEHTGVPKPSAKCEVCGLTYTNKYLLARHKKTTHSIENAVSQMCTVCSKVLPTISAFRRHVYNVHNKERKHACPMCEKAFKDAKGLKEHMATHTGDVLYTCTYCPKTFNSNGNMYSHRKKVHRKEWEENQSHSVTLNDIAQK